MPFTEQYLANSAFSQEYTGHVIDAGALYLSSHVKAGIHSKTGATRLLDSIVCGTVKLDVALLGWLPFWVTSGIPER